MFEIFKIKFFGIQPAAKVTDAMIERIIQRDFKYLADDVKQRLKQIISDTNGGKNRISAAIIKLANKNFISIDHYVEISQNDFRDVISQAEYPRWFNLGFKKTKEFNIKQVYLNDWLEYSKWLNH